MGWRATARRVFLVLAAVVFLYVAGGSLLKPAWMAEPIDYRWESTNAWNEFRAVYVGLWIAHAALCLWAAWRIDLPILGDFMGILILSQFVGRALSVAIDGWPDARLIGPAVGELAAGVLILAVRPRVVTAEPGRSQADGA